MVDITAMFKDAIAASPFSEAEVARRFGTSPQNLHQRFLRGKYSSDDINRLADALGLEATIKLKKKR